MTSSRPAIGTAVVAVAVAALTVAALAGLRTIHAVTTADGRQAATAQNRLFSCLEHRLHELVPRGSRVAVRLAPGSPSVYQQRLTEWSTGWATVVPDPVDAQFVLSVVKASPGACTGADVSAVAPG